MEADVWDLYYRRHPTDWKGTDLPRIEPGSRVLDVGCGTGSTLLRALESGFEASGIDFSEEAVSRAKERLSSKGLGADVMVMDILSDLGDLGEFDCILLHHMLDSLLSEERLSAVKNCRGILREGGTISFVDLSRNDIRYGKGEPLEEGTFRKKDGIICHFFTVEEARELFDGMEEVALDKVEWEQGSGNGRIRRSRIVGLFRA
ncbi:MAG: class I SAM-dependent methyltransferase [Thermoplasmatota archaeon]